MIIFQDLVLNWKTGAFQGRFDPKYFGPVAMADFGGGGSTTETVPTGPWYPQIPYVVGLFDEAARLYNQGTPQAYSGQLTPDINPNLGGSQAAAGGITGGNIGQNQEIQQGLQQFAGQTNPGAQVGQNLLPWIYGGINQQVGGQNNPTQQFAQQQAPNAQGAFGSVFGQDPNQGQVTAGGTQGGQANVNPALFQQLAGGGGQNPYLDSLVQDAVQTQVNQFQRNILPSIGAEAGQAGQPGGSRQGIAEGIAAGDLVNSIGNTASNIYGNAFNTQANLQGQAVQNVLNAQQGDQSAQLQAAGLSNQAYQQYINSLLSGTGQIGQLIGQGTGQGFEAVGTGTAQAGNLFGQGNSLQLQQTLQSLGMIPGFQASSLANLGALNQLGLQQYGLDQNSIDALQQQYYYNQAAPFNLLSQFQQYITGPYGSTIGQTTYADPYGYGNVLSPGQQAFPNAPTTTPTPQFPSTWGQFLQQAGGG
jgi:hypothetical protein